MGRINQMQMCNKGRAIVMRSTGSNYSLRDIDSEEVLDAKLRGRLRLKGVRSTNPVVVGDVVRYEVDEIGEVLITEVEQRRNYIIRRASNLSRESHIIAANIDQAMLVATIVAPQTNVEFLDRFLVTCSAYKIPAIIILNKIDLMVGAEELVEEFEQIYKLAGYEVLRVSSTKGEGIEAIRARVEGKTTLFSGNSGVGKSTLINLLDASAGAKVGAISKAHYKGRHTTTFSEMYQLKAGGFIIDTPGIKGFGLLDIAPEELWHYFPEMMRFGEQCRFYNCTHRHEPECAVLEAIEQGDIAESRYVSYLKMLEEDGKHR